MNNILKYQSTRLAIDNIRKIGQGKEYSDIIQETDNGTLQYVDLVMEGGGVLGIALVGYIYALEQAGIRFLSIGGTSAGAIVATMLMGVGKREEEKGERLLAILESMPMQSFIDGPWYIRWLSLLWVSSLTTKSIFLKIIYTKKIIPCLSTIILGIPSLIYFHYNKGFHPGQKFMAWLSGELEKNDAWPFKKLNEKITKIPKKVFYRDKSSKQKITLELGLISADITTETKAQFPKMASMYWGNLNQLDPANFVRASMSIPLFFHPFAAKQIHNIDKYKNNWSKLGKFKNQR